MESTSCDEEGSLRDNNVDLNEENIENHMSLEVSSQLVEADNLFASNQPNSENPEPFVGMEFESEEGAKLFYMAYASRIGFSVRISKSRRSRNDESIIMRRFVCSKEGFHLKKGNFDDGKKKRKRATIREGCNAMIEVIQKYYGRWVVTKLVKEHNHVVAAPSRVRYIEPEEYAHLDPFLGMEFPSHEAAQTFYYAYASRTGFDVRIRLSRRSTRDESFVMRRFVCTKEGFTPSEENYDESKKKRNSRTPTREGCKAMFEVIKKDYDKWIVSKLVLEHTHDLAVAPNKIHYIQSQSEVVVLGKSGTLNREKSLLPPLSKPPIGESLGGFNNSPPYDHDFRNERREARYTAFGFDETQKLLGYFKRMNAENPTTFSYAFQVDKNNCLTHAFWADAKARASYYYFGDAVSFDTSFKENKDLLPFFMFTGLNHHLQSVIFGCALLTDEAEASFIWLFENWVAAMGARHPTSLVTEFNEAMGVAISKVFPETHHRFCKWHILNQCKEQLANIYGTSATFEEEFERCIVESESIELFESTWKSVIDKYDLGENSWLRFLYNMRQKWVPVFFKDMFTAEISATQKPESLKFFFEKYFNTTTPLPVFISLFEHAIAGWCEREALEDLATSFTRPVLKTPSNILKQVADVYTRAIFNIFQDEFIHSLGYYVDKIEDGLVSKFNVAKEEDIHRSCTVTYDFSDKRSKCSCSKFENCGILCRHILRVFLTVDVRALPEFYILKRWTKEAKNGFMLDECIRYNELYRDAVRYAKEGSTSSDVFNFAQQTLQVAFADVVQMKQDIVNRCAM
ncbi:protein FAR1-RELATED SEQUENCE 5-like [Ananas comosus]|uniref:Protein FAR1-RELATED SEQUENCE n=1 Tax=Ananas comosus TaxID=4615 RepID=A0A6P5F9H1_ANACO|nr:protein FAR1-RELATED SEQUENCE 5-like [Ananas comosus]